MPPDELPLGYRHPRRRRDGRLQRDGGRLARVGLDDAPAGRVVDQNSVLTETPNSNKELLKYRVFAKKNYLTETIHFGQNTLFWPKQALLVDYLQSLLANYLTKK